LDIFFKVYLYLREVVRLKKFIKWEKENSQKETLLMAKEEL
jgi:hypothetical protein